MKAEITPEFINSVERLNIFYHIHHCNAQILSQISMACSVLEKNPDQTLAREALQDLLGSIGDFSQSVDGLMHICQKEVTGPAQDWINEASPEEQIEMRDNVNTPILDKMVAILSETEEERTQRILLEHLGIHE